MTFNNAQTRTSCSFKYTRTSVDNIYACVTIQKSIPASMISYKTMNKTIQLLQIETNEYNWKAGSWLGTRRIKNIARVIYVREH